MLVVGIIASAIVGPKLDIQFAGGSMITYTVEGGEVSGEEVQGVIEEEMGRECSVSVDQSLNGGGVNVTVSFSGNTTITPDEQTQAAQALTDAFEGRTFTLLESNSVDATMGARFLQKCLVCFAITFVLLLIYIALRFRKIGGLSAGVSAIVALIHDVLVATCVFVVFGLPISDIFIAVVLTILGYSLNATIVIYDRVRENKRKMGPKVSFQEVMNTSLTQSFGRTFLTSLATFLSLLVVLVVAGIYSISTVVSFSLPMMIGVVAGCYSSQVIAPNIFAQWQIHKRKKLDEAKALKSGK